MQATPESIPELLSVKDILKYYGIAKSTTWYLSKRGQFPTPLNLSSRLTRWRRSDIERHLENLKDEI